MKTTDEEIKKRAGIKLTYEAGAEGLESLADVRFAGCHFGFLLLPAFFVGFGLQLRLLECLFSGLKFGFQFIGSLQGNSIGSP